MDIHKLNNVRIVRFVCGGQTADIQLRHVFVSFAAVRIPGMVYGNIKADIYSLDCVPVQVEKDKTVEEFLRRMIKATFNELEIGAIFFKEEDGETVAFVELKSIPDKTLLRTFMIHRRNR